MYNEGDNTDCNGIDSCTTINTVDKDTGYHRRLDSVRAAYAYEQRRRVVYYDITDTGHISLSELYSLLRQSDTITIHKSILLTGNENFCCAFPVAFIEFPESKYYKKIAN